MSSKKNQNIDNIVRCYEVTEPTLHPKGYTIYKVTERIICIDALEQNVKEAVIWRRFNDFRKLHKSLSALHAALHRREQFPDFPKPQLFHRFDKSVVVDRMRSAQDLLNFAGQRHYLVGCKAFKEFFSGAQPVATSEKEDIMLLPNQSFSITERSSKEANQLVLPPGDGQESKEMAQEHQVDSKSCEAVTASSLENLVHDPTRTDFGEGFWCYRQTQEETSSGGHEEDDDNDDDSESDDDNFLPDILSGTPTFGSSSLLNGSELVLFDPLAGDSKEVQQNEPSNEYLLSLLTVGSGHCGNSGQQMADRNASASVFETALDTCACAEEIQELSLSSKYASDLADILSGTAEQRSETSANQLESSAVAHSRTRKGSVVESGRGDLTVSPLHQLEEPKTLSSFYGSLAHAPSSRTASPKKLSWTANIPYFNTLDKSGYIVEAAEQISHAQKFEAAEAYHEAFCHYKCGVGILLKGVQKDGDEKQREAVRRKISIYLKKAEELYHEHLIDNGSECSGNRWDLEPNSSFTELDSSIALLRGAVAELGQFKVVGLINKVMLVVDTGTDGNYVIKVLHKSSMPLRSQRTIVPTHIPYMVSLVKFFETDSSIFLILQHAAGVTLWNYVSSYFGQFNQDGGQEVVADICGDLHEKQLRSAGRKMHSLQVQQAMLSFNPKTGDQCDQTIMSAKSNIDCDEFVTNNDLKPQNRNETDVNSDSLSFTGDLLPSLHTKCLSETCSQDVPADPQELSRSTEKSSVYDPSTESATGSSVPNALDSNQDFTAILQSCQTDINSYSICSIDSDSTTLSRMASFSSDQLESSAASEVNIQTSLTLPLTEDQLEVNRSFPSLHGSNFGSNVLPTATALVPAGLQSAEDTGHPQSSNQLTKSEVAKSKCNMNLPLGISVSRTNGKTKENVAQQVHLTELSCKEPLKSPSMSQLPSQESDSSSGGSVRRRCRTLSSVFAELDLAADIPGDIRHTMHLPEGCIRQWAAEIVVALSRLHCLGIVCRDLHPDNILLGDSGHLLLTYFSQWNTVDCHISSEALYGLYSAPEVSGVSEITAACDWWSLGAILFELFTGQSLRACHPAGITAHSSVTLPNHVSEEACSLITELLKFSPTERLGSGIGGSEDVRSHPFFAGIQWNHLLG